VRYEFKPSFDRSIKSLQPGQKDEVKAACFSFLDALEARTPMPTGIGLKRLHNDFWEVRHGLRSRILFRWRQDLIEFVLAGDHDSIKDFLKDR
jgi:mRNA-degrading endonuclease RelE of RelBE toxin-antitoxin system